MKGWFDHIDHLLFPRLESQRSDLEQDWFRQPTVDQFGVPVVVAFDLVVEVSAVGGDRG